MSDSSIDKEIRDNHFVQTVHMDTEHAPPQQMVPYQRMYANPAPVGLLAYGTVMLTSSILTLHAGNVYTPNIVLLTATFYGGITQTLVGLWEIFLGNTYNASVFITYGGFNLSYGALYMPQLGIAAAYSVNGVPTQEFYNAVGIYLGVWDFVTLCFLIGALRTTVPIICTLGFTVASLTCLAANAFTGNAHLATAGGAFGVTAAMCGFYGALSMLWTHTTTFSFIRMPHLVVAPSNA